MADLANANRRNSERCGMDFSARRLRTGLSPVRDGRILCLGNFIV